MWERTIPGRAPLRARHLVLDYNGTLARGGHLLEGVREHLEKLAGEFEIWVLTADTFGSAGEQLAGCPVRLQRIGAEDQGPAKERFLRSLPGGVVALGNGANDREMLGAADLSVAVLEAEGLCGTLLGEADLLARSIGEALDLLGDPKALAATLRR